MRNNGSIATFEPLLVQLMTSRISLSFPAENQLNLTCHFRRGTIDPKDQSIYEFVHISGSSRLLSTDDGESHHFWFCSCCWTFTCSGCLSETEYSATVVSHLAELDCDLIRKLAEGRCLWLNSGTSLVRPT